MERPRLTLSIIFQMLAAHCVLWGALLLLPQGNWRPISLLIAWTIIFTSFPGIHAFVNATNEWLEFITREKDKEDVSN